MKSIMSRMIEVAQPDKILVFELHPADESCESCNFDNEDKYPLLTKAQTRLVLRAFFKQPVVYHLGFFDTFDGDRHLTLSVADAKKQFAIKPFNEFLFKGKCSTTNFNTNLYKNEMGTMEPLDDGTFELRGDNQVIGLFTLVNEDGKKIWGDTRVTFPSIDRLIADTQTLCGTQRPFVWHIDSEGLIMIESI